ncbi:MAG: hypothetical protein ABI867_28320 [Kofleriaceae bacterium]
MLRPAVVLSLLLAACGGGGSQNPGDDDDDVDAPPPIDADLPNIDSSIDKSAGCVSNFGNDLTDGFGRLDGILVAVVPPGSDCPRPNDDHIILEVRQGGKVFRMVGAVISGSGNPVMAMAERDAALTGPAWSEGWHPGIAFDYVTTMGLHRLDFTPTPMQDMVDAIDRAAVINGKISIFATVEDQHDSAHLIHRNEGNKDGAIVIDAAGSPHYMMFRFDNQLF